MRDDVSEEGKNLDEDDDVGPMWRLWEDPRAESSRELGFVTESTVVARRELGAEPYRISPPVLLPPFGPSEPCDDEEVDDGYMAFFFLFLDEK